MRPGGGHSKGAAFERQIAKDIVKAFAEFGVQQRDCWRSVLSGGHEMSAGDLEMTPKMESLFPWCVECKCWAKIDWQNFILIPKKKSWKEVQWVSQAIEGANKRKPLFPLLVVKENRGPVLVLYDLRDIRPGLMSWKDFLKGAVERAKGLKERGSQP